MRQSLYFFPVTFNNIFRYFKLQIKIQGNPSVISTPLNDTVFKKAIVILNLDRYIQKKNFPL